MRFSSLTFILVAASASLGLAAPIDARSDSIASTDSTQQGCDHNWTLCGCAGRKGGDGKHCGIPQKGGLQCPGY
ncbi:hypothetical protein N7517_007738 [Penicillium concentricum]|uniref:Uncharacterized protein n=1 Tax=Penicillium concentricum TaxID=293559 RepID=A0A9W9VBD0_9EURO|nr:uncharacterized protein N7517_007738 [Penicillium concentricum]KAJ5375732.1 hypothetical protein N7517_007738 [Penicillium concentricum]